MSNRINFFTLVLSFFVSLIFHGYFLLSFDYSSMKFTQKNKNKIIISLSPIGEQNKNQEKRSIKKEMIIPEKKPVIKKKTETKDKIKEKVIDIKKIIPQKKSIERKVEKNEESESLKGVEGGQAKGIINQYVTQIYKLIDSKKKYPRQSLIRKEEGVVMLQIIIRNDGRLISLKSLKAKHQRLVDSSFEAVERAAPFPAFPKQITKKRMVIEVPVIYKIR